MSDNEQVISKEEKGTLNFGNHLLTEKTKAEDFEFNGDLYKVKTFNEVTKLERNGMFVYESVPGTTVSNFRTDAKETVFNVEGSDDVQITLELEEGKEYLIFIDNKDVGTMMTNLSGKLVISVELNAGQKVSVRVEKM